MEPCRNCQSVRYSTMRTWYDNETQQMNDMCDRCGDFTPMTNADVFFVRPYTSKALNVEFTSKGQKAAYLKANGLSEAGDRGTMSEKSWTEGTREHRKKEFDRVDRPKIREAIRTWRERARRK